MAWEYSTPAYTEGISFRQLPPRLARLHAFMHNQLDDAGFILGDLRLRRLLEFALLRAAHPDPLDDEWLDQWTRLHDCSLAFQNYASMADRLFFDATDQAIRTDLLLWLVRQRTHLHIRYPLLTQLVAQAMSLGRAAHRPIGLLIRELVSEELYQRKKSQIRRGRRYN
jgi:hypothetical protein